MQKRLCFITSMLQVVPDVKGAPDIRRRTNQLLLEWEQVKFQMLTSRTILCAAANMRRKKGKANVDEIAKVLTSLVCRGKIRSAIRHACERDKGGVLMPGDTERKTGDIASDTLHNEHTDGQDVDTENLPVFEDCPDLTDAMVADDAVEEVAKHISGGTGPSGFGSSLISQWQLKHRGTSAKSLKTTTSLVE